MDTKNAIPYALPPYNIRRLNYNGKEALDKTKDNAYIKPSSNYFSFKSVSKSENNDEDSSKDGSMKTVQEIEELLGQNKGFKNITEIRELMKNTDMFNQTEVLLSEEFKYGKYSNQTEIYKKEKEKENQNELNLTNLINSDLFKDASEELLEYDQQNSNIVGNKTENHSDKNTTSNDNNDTIYQNIPRFLEKSESSTATKSEKTDSSTKSQLQTSSKEKNSQNYMNLNDLPTHKEITKRVMSDSSSGTIISQSVSNNNNSEVIYPKEIHSVQTFTQNQIKTQIVDPSANTRKMILDNVLSEKSFNELLTPNNQSTGPSSSDETGLYDILKKIQNQQCSGSYLCAEIGTIYGDFNYFKPTVQKKMVQESTNVDLIIKPVIIYVNETSLNNTSSFNFKVLYYITLSKLIQRN